MISPGLSVTVVSDTDLVLTRAFDAARRTVFAAFTRPDLLRRWYGARGWNLIVCEVDLRPGGAWRYVSRGPGGAEMGHGGVYVEVDPPGRLVQTEVYDGWEEGHGLITTVLDEREGQTLMTTTVRYPSREIRDMVLRTPMERGAGEAYDRLAAVLREMKGEPR